MRDDPDNVEKRMSYISSYMTVLERDGFSEDELREVLIGTLKKERERAKVDLKSSLIMKMVLQRAEKTNESFIRFKNILKDDFADDPMAQEVLNLIESRE
jgi:hypothetical protein